MNRRRVLMVVVATSIFAGVVAAWSWLGNVDRGQPALAGPGGLPKYEACEETEWTASRMGIDYRTLVLACMTGDEESIVRLMRFSTSTDAAGAIGHSVSLAKVLQAVGDREFARIAGNQSPQVRAAIRNILPAATYSSDAWCHSFSLKSQPMTAKALEAEAGEGG
ncbi:MAG: hypothetical protein NTW19_07005 [Planctomycetota bacterium]|nr:hypothetical protein [Planctomycetota bacterium]